MSGAGQYRTDIDSPSFDNLERLIIQNSEYRPRGWHPFPELLPADHPSKKTQDFTKLESFQLVRAFSFSSRSDVIKSLTSSPNLRHLDLVDAFYLHPSQAIYDCPATLERLTLIGSSQLEMLSIWSSYQFKKLERLKRLTVGVLGHESSPFFDMWMLPPNLETLTVMVCECVWKMDEFDTQGLARFVCPCQGGEFRPHLNARGDDITSWSMGSCAFQRSCVFDRVVFGGIVRLLLR